nr:hypothetical protein [Paenibacillus algorifonticola]
MTASGVGEAIAGYAQMAHMSPLVLGFVIAGLIRAANAEDLDGYGNDPIIRRFCGRNGA